MPNETDVRIIIDRLLHDADWDIEDKAQVSTEEAAADSRADYMLKDSRSRPLAVIEAKPFSIEPYTAKDQARAYVQSPPVYFVILSNGNDHYFWGYAGGDARPILGLPTQADLERRANLKQQRQSDLGREHRSLFETIEVNAELPPLQRALWLAGGGGDVRRHVERGVVVSGYERSLLWSPSIHRLF